MAIFLSFIITLAAAVLTPLSAQAQQAGKVPRVGWLSEGPAPSGSSENLEAFRQGLRDLGYVEGQNIIIEYRYAEGREDRLPDLAAELVRLKTDAIVADGGVAIRTAKNTTQTIPIIIVTSTDPVATGLVASFARPGGNITGIVTLSPELIGKRLGILKESFPRVSRVGVLTGGTGPAAASRLKEMESAARSLGLKLQILEVKKPDDFGPAFQAATKGRTGALIELPGRIFHENGKLIADSAARKRLPAVFHTRDFVEAGGLMSYGANYPDLHRRTAIYVDKILKGRKPVELPVEQPIKFELVINLKAAKQIGITIPQSVLYRADKVIK